jgi:hypothetical protein
MERNVLAVTLLVAVLVILITVLASTMGSGASEVVDNFEWKTPGINKENGADQWTGGTLTDKVTGEVYVVYENRVPISQRRSEDAIVCAHLDPDTGALTDRWVFEYHIDDTNHFYYFPSYRQFLVHDGHFFFLYHTKEDMMVHLRMDNMAEDRKRWYIGEYPMQILGVREGSLLFTVNKWDSDAIVLFSVSLRDFNTTQKEIFTYTFDPTGERFLYRMGTIYAVFWKQNRYGPSNYSFNLWIDRYYVGLELRVGPTEVDMDSSEYWGSFLFDVDSEENYHIMRGDPDYLLRKVSPSGEVVATFDVGHLMDDIDVNFSLPWLDVLVNRTDHVYLLGRIIPNHYSNTVLCSFALTSDYTDVYLRNIIVSGPVSFAGRPRSVVMNGTGDIFISWGLLVDDFYRIFFSYQIPLTPDLEVNPSGFRFREVFGAPDPIEISIQVTNVGRADSRSHWVEVSYSLDGDEPFTIVLDRLVGIPLAPNEECTFNESIALPQGNIRLRLRIHDVSPYENNRANNIILRWFFVSNNNPPTIHVEFPENGSTHRDTMTVAGITDDLDLGGTVTTTMMGLPSLPVAFDGRGSWNRTLGLSDIPSGVYVLSFRAHDGDHYSEVVYRIVRVAGKDDVLRLASLHPSNDVILLEGDRFTFHFNATDPLTSNLNYRWSLRSGDWVKGRSSFLYLADTVGIHQLRVEVSNGFTDLSHVWNVTVMELIAPSIGAVEPADPEVTLRKREEMRFSIGVINPHEQPFTLKWTLDGKVLSGHGKASLLTNFEISGHHTLSIKLFTASSQDSIIWNITVTNEAPDIVGWTPHNRTLTINDAMGMVFEVDVTDADNDVLLYEWSVDGDVLVDEDTQVSSIDLPFVNMTDYHVIVTVSDGEETTEYHWTVHPQSIERPEDPTVPDEETGPWRTASVGLLVAGVIIVVIVLSYLYVRWKEV